MDDAKRDKTLHNTLEKNRRAHLKECFENLQNELPQYKEKKATNLCILNYTVKYLEQHKRKDKENELERERLLKRQQLLNQALKQLISDIQAESKSAFDYGAWLAATAAMDNGLDDLNFKSELLENINRIEQSMMLESLNSRSSTMRDNENSFTFNDDYEDDEDDDELNDDNSVDASCSNASGKHFFKDQFSDHF